MKEKINWIFKIFHHRVLPPIFILIGLTITAASAIILWRQDPTAPPRKIIFSLMSRPYILGATVALTLLGITIAFFLSSKETQKKFVGAVLMVLAPFLVFIGPTYLIYVLQRVLQRMAVPVPYYLLVFLGLASLVAGLFLFARLLKGKE